MDIKELAVGGVIVIGGVAFTVSQGGLGDALSDDVKHISEVPYNERPAYMSQIVESFSENFSNYIIQTETYNYVGYSTFSMRADQGKFVEVVQSKEQADQKDTQSVKTLMQQSDFCAQDEMTMFTEKGWSYWFTMKDAQGRRIYTITCKPDAAGANLSS